MPDDDEPTATVPRPNPIDWCTIPKGDKRDQFGQLLELAEDTYSSMHWRRQARAELIQQVSTGEITPSQAECAVLAAQEEPFTRKPDSLNVFDATIEIWTPEMTAVWIASLDIEKVYRHHEKTCEKALIWHPNKNRYVATERRLRKPWERGNSFSDRTGFDLTIPPQTQLFSDFYDFEGKPAEFPVESVWFPRLLVHLLSGKIVARGHGPASGSPICAITSDQWLSAKFDTHDGRAVVLINGGRAYFNIKFRASEIFKEFKPSNFVPRPILSFSAWLPEMPTGIEPYKREIAQAVKALCPEGFPISKPKTIRDGYLREIMKDTLGNYPLLERWYGDKTQQGDVAFSKAMDRLTKETTGMQIIEIPDNKA